MEKIEIKARRDTAAALAALEKKGLIRLLKATAKVTNVRTGTGAVDVHYRSDPRHGGHCLIGVGKRNTDIEFSWHPGNEDLILLKPGAGKFKRLFLVVSLLKGARFLKALEKGKLTAADFAAVELVFNDPRTMYFTVLKDTVHCEITDRGPGQHPVFFVSEPSKLKMNRIKTKKYIFCLAGER
jgi:hypothetical protein